MSLTEAEEKFLAANAIEKMRTDFQMSEFAFATGLVLGSLQNEVFVERLRHEVGVPIAAILNARHDLSAIVKYWYSTRVTDTAPSHHSTQPS